ncbi:hypothetical protein K1719_016271 [Acacia pycnantha]|nr:hypothetical protein K1719_016271 [Acacia pycnantha]
MSESETKRETWTQEMDDALVDAFLHQQNDGNRNGLSGFAWDSTTKQWCLEPEVWLKLIEAKPEAKEWMGKSIHNYDKLMIVCGGDRASGQHSETSKDMRNKRKQLPGESESIETIGVTFESAQEVGNENEVTSPEVQDTRTKMLNLKGLKGPRMKKLKG